jgi:hypothetical protein
LKETKSVKRDIKKEIKPERATKVFGDYVKEKEEGREKQ